MKCLIEHKNYNQFEEVYGDQGVNLVHSILLDIPLKENIDNLLDGKTINELEKLILFYENLGETNNHIENYKKELFIQLDELKNPKVETTDEKQNQTEV